MKNDPGTGTNDDAPINLEIGKRFGSWKIIAKIDEGGFGSVYRVENKEKKVAALKAESNDTEGGSAIKLEIAILLSIHKDVEKPYFPMIFHSAKRKKYCYMILTLLGENIRTLKMNQPNERLSLSTWIRVAIQGLYSLKILHDEGFLHRDIKPANFVMGVGERAKMLHLIDFGLSRSYAAQNSKNVWIARKARTVVDFRGTMRYCAPNVHRNLEQGRRDDIYSFMYVLIELNSILPWQNERFTERLEHTKLNISDRALLLDFPEELHFILPHLRSLTVYNRPDYAAMHEAMMKVMQRAKIQFSDPYDWETSTRSSERSPSRPNASKQSQLLPHEDENASSEFFSSDPIKVNGPPIPTKARSRGQSLDGRFSVEEVLKKVQSERSPAANR